MELCKLKFGYECLVNTKHGISRFSMFPFSMLIFLFSSLILASYDCFSNKIGDKGKRWQM
jgi:hypothetical protein